MFATPSLVQMKAIKARNDDFKEDEPEMDRGTHPREGEDKYQAMILTPGGSIIAIGNPNQVPKPETDPDWEERKAQWDAERKQAQGQG